MRIVAVVAALLLAFAPAPAPAQNAATRPTRPAPRWPDGTINLGAPPGERGMWDGAEPLVTLPNNYEAQQGRPRPGLIHVKDVPLQDWARRIIDIRHERFLADEPYTRCKPSPAARAFGTAYGIDLVNTPGSGVIYLFQMGGAHSFRVIYMDARSHPAHVQPSHYGHSIGWWEGDTLVIDTVGFDESAWIERWGMPHTAQLRTVERVTRLDFDTMKYEITVDDPGAYTAPWTTGYTKRFNTQVEPFEYVCQENNYAPHLMIGVEGGERRTSIVVP